MASCAISHTHRKLFLLKTHLMRCSEQELIYNLLSKPTPLFLRLVLWYYLHISLYFSFLSFKKPKKKPLQLTEKIHAKEFHH